MSENPIENYSQLLTHKKTDVELQRAKHYYPAPSDSFVGSEPEWAIYWALTKLKAEFDFQSGFMGGKVAGGQEVDFVVTFPANVLIRVQGGYWHYEQGTDKLALDDMNRGTLSARGYEVVDIDEEDAMDDPLFYTKEAFRGVDHSYRQANRH